VTEQEFGRYRLRTRLGRGGMGEVWRALDTAKDREVALKVLGSWLGGDPQFADRFRRESAVAARLNAPNIIPIHDYGEIDGRLYIDMPLINGVDLGALLEQGPLEPARVVGIITQVARALDVAHRAGLVHRDVKPSNILVCTDSDDHTYLIDFGIAKAIGGTQLSMSGAVVGTAAYMAPECFTGVGDARSDVYSLGCVLFEALTAQPPFDAPHVFAYARMHENAPPPRPSAVRAEVPAALDAVVARALAKAPDARFPTTGDLAAAARAALTAPPVPGPADRRPWTAPTVVTPVPPQPPGPRFYGPPATYRPPMYAPPLPAPAAPPARSRRGAWLVGALLAVLVLVVVGVVALRPSGSPTPLLSPPSTSTPSSTAVADPVRNLVLTGHTDTVYVVGTTELDGRPVAVSASKDRTVRIWDLTTGQQVGQPLTGHTDEVGGMALTQLDGRPVAVTGSSDNTVRVWDLTTGRERGQPLTGHTGGIGTVAVAQIDGRPVAVTGSADKTVRVWDLTTGQQRGEPLTGHTDVVYAVTTGEIDGRPVAVSVGKDRTVRVWDLTTGQQRGQPLTGHNGDIDSVAVTQLDGRPVAVTSSSDETLRIWDLTAGHQVGEPLTGHTDYVFVVTTTQLDGRPVAVSGAGDNTVRLWDLTTGRELGQPVPGHTDSVWALAITQLDGRAVALSGSADRTVRVWDLRAAAGL
jgi:eukaryotic-like serine/threonine-protein kinase